MRYEWIRSPSFWLSMSIPAATILAFSAAQSDVILDAPDRMVAVFLFSLVVAFAVGIRIAAQEHRLVRDTGTTAAAEQGSLLSAEQAATYRDLFENATDIVFTTDLSGHFLAGNKAVQRLLGYTVEEAKSLTWEKLVAPYDMWKARQMYKRHAAGEKQISFELDTVTASGEVKTFEIGSRPMFREDQLCGFHGIARDITSRKEMEKQLQAAHREAEQANASKSTFLANMSHEIRTPINGILGFLSLFAKTELTSNQKEYLVPIEESAKHLLKIINDILDLSKIEAGRFSIENEIFSYRNVVKSAVELLRPLGEEKGLAVSVDFDARIPRFVVGDGTRIGQIVSNLVSNAIKFTDAGSVSVRCRATQFDSLDLTVEVCVRDTGIGIRAGNLVELFEPFQQLETTPNRKYPGTGLGLTISKNLVEAMGGEIRISSEPGKYTEVTFELPLGQAPIDFESSSGKSSDMSHRFDARGLSALIVDDNQINRWYLETVLDQHGFEVHQVESGGLALEACRQQDFNVVFMDIHMADMDGIETTRRVRAQLSQYKNIPIVAVSADVVGNKGARFIEQGLDYFLSKPVKESALAGLLYKIFPGNTVPGEIGDSDPSRCRTAEDILDRAQGLELASNDEMLWRKCVAVLKEQARDVLPRIRIAVTGGEHDQVRQLAHRLAGSAGYVAAQEVEQIARCLEEAAGQGEIDRVKHQLTELEKAVERLTSLDIDT